MYATVFLNGQNGYILTAYYWLLQKKKVKVNVCRKQEKTFYLQNRLQKDK